MDKVMLNTTDECLFAVWQNARPSFVVPPFARLVMWAMLDFAYCCLLGSVVLVVRNLFGFCSKS